MAQQVKNLSANSGNIGDVDLIPRLGRYELLKLSSNNRILST